MKTQLKLVIFVCFALFWSCKKEACMSVNANLVFVLQNKSGTTLTSAQNYREFSLRYTQNNEPKAFYPDDMTVDGAIVFRKLASICATVHNFELYQGNKKLGDIFLKGRVESLPCALSYVHERLTYNGTEIPHTDASFFRIIIDAEQ